MKIALLVLLMVCATQLYAALYALRLTPANSELALVWTEMYHATTIPFEIGTIEVTVDTLPLEDDESFARRFSISPSTPFNDYLASMISGGWRTQVVFPMKVKIDVLPIEKMHRLPHFQIVPNHTSVLAGEATNIDATDAVRAPDLDGMVAVEREPSFDVKKLSSCIVYPERARSDGIEGEIIVAALVGRNGAVEQVLILESDDEIFNGSALKAVAVLEFQPAIQNGKPLRTWVRIPIQYKLR